MPILDDTSRGILEFRPDITFIEPEVQPGEIDPVEEPIEAEPEQIKQLAVAVDVLAAVIQARVDDLAKDIVIDVDPDVDIAAMQAMQRHFPNVNPLEITYQQYKECKDEILALGVEVGKQAITTPEEVSKFTDDARKANRNQPSLAAAQMGGFGTRRAARGGLRPELQKRAQIIKPLEIQKLQISLICILVNFIWRNFVLPAFKPIGIPLIGSLADILPKRLCNPGAPIEIPDLFILGTEIPAILTGKNQPKIPKEAPEVNV